MLTLRGKCVTVTYDGEQYSVPGDEGYRAYVEFEVEGTRAYTKIGVAASDASRFVYGRTYKITVSEDAA